MPDPTATSAKRPSKRKKSTLADLFRQLEKLTGWKQELPDSFFEPILRAGFNRVRILNAGLTGRWSLYQPRPRSLVDFASTQESYHSCRMRLSCFLVSPAVQERIKQNQEQE